MAVTSHSFIKLIYAGGGGGGGSVIQQGFFCFVFNVSFVYQASAATVLVSWYLGFVSFAITKRQWGLLQCRSVLGGSVVVLFWRSIHKIFNTLSSDMSKTKSIYFLEVIS